MIAMADLYDVEPRHVVSFDLTKLKVASKRIVSKEAGKLLPMEAAGILRGPRTNIKKSALQLEETDWSSLPRKPYCDPMLPSSRDKMVSAFGDDGKVVLHNFS